MAVCLAGCIDRSSSTAEPDRVGDGAPTDALGDASNDRDGSPPDLMPPRDAMPRDAMPRDAMPRDAMPLDAMPRDAMPRDAMPRDAMPRDAMPRDAMPPDAALEGPPVDPPTHDQVAVLRWQGGTAFVYVDAEGRVVALPVDADGALGASAIIGRPEARPERVAVARVGDRAWVAYGSAGGPIELTRLDAPEARRQVLDDLWGPPLVAPAGDGLLVVGRTVAGALAWRRIGPDGVPGARVVDAYDRGWPDDAAATSTGVVLLFGHAGQCLHISEEDWRTVGSLVCPAERGRLVSDGQRTVLTHLLRRGEQVYVGVLPLHADLDSPAPILRYVAPAGLRLPTDGSDVPIVGSTANDDDTPLVLTVIGPRGVWDSVRTWSQLDPWPFEAVRAVARRTLPDRQVAGACADGARCAADALCADGSPCAGAVGAEHAIALVFRADGPPGLRTFELRPRAMPAPAHGIPDPIDCAPRPEVCDGLDQDCDGVADDGRCCPGSMSQSAVWETPAPIAAVEAADGPTLEVLLTADPRSAGRHVILYRLEDTDEWQGRITRRQADLPDEPPDVLGVRISGARHGRFLEWASGVIGLVARAVEDDGLGGWALFLAHPSRQPAPTRVDLDCEDVLGLAVMEPEDFVARPSEQFLVVCPDRVIRASVDPEVEPIVDRFADLGLPDIRWVTAAGRLGDTTLLVGYPSPGGGWALASLGFRLDDAGPPSREPLPLQLTDLPPDAAEWPIHPPGFPWWSAVQIRDGASARVTWRVTDPDGQRGPVWRDVVFTPGIERMVFGPISSQVYGAAAVALGPGFEAATAWWAASLVGRGQVYDLWSTEPIARVEGPVARWHVVQQDRSNGGRVEPRERELGILSPTDDSGRRWRFTMTGGRCRAPASL